jgi:D-serine dehydratase
MLEQFDDKPIGQTAMLATQARFERFAPLLEELFPELMPCRGHIESDRLPIPEAEYQKFLNWAQEVNL